MRTHIDEVINDLADIVYQASEFRRIMSLPNCNNCGKNRSCEYTPKPGEFVRVNCPLWEGGSNG